MIFFGLCENKHVKIVKKNIDRRLTLKASSLSNRRSERPAEGVYAGKCTLKECPSKYRWATPSESIEPIHCYPGVLRTPRLLSGDAFSVFLHQCIIRWERVITNGRIEHSSLFVICNLFFCCILCKAFGSFR